MLLGDGCSTVCKQKVSDRCLMFSQVKSTARECQSRPYGKDTPTPKHWNEPVHLPAAPVHIQTQSLWFCFTVTSLKWKLLNYFQYIYFFFQFFYPPIITSSENKAQLNWNWNAENKGVEMTSLTLAKLLVTPLNSRCAVNLSPLSLCLCSCFSLKL